MVLARAYRAALAALVALTCADRASAVLFDDQKGSNNWVKGHIGAVQQAYVASSPSALVTSTELGVVASLSLRDGSIRWQREQDAFYLDVVDEHGIVLAADRHNVHAWQSGTGLLLWAHPLDASLPQQPTICTTPSRMFVLESGTLTSVRMTKGTRAWQRPVLTSPYTKATCFATENEVHIFAVDTDASKLMFTTVDVKTGQNAGVTEAAAKHKMSTHLAATEHRGLILSKDGQHLCSVSFADEAGASTCVDVPGTSEPAALYGTASGCVIRSKDSATLVEGSAADFDFDVTATIESDAVSAPLHVAGQDLLAAVEAKSVGLVITVYDMKGVAVTDVKINEDTFKDSNGDRSHVEALWILPVKTAGEEGVPTFRFLLRSKDGTLAMLRFGKGAWTLHEGLARIEEALFLDLPPAGNPHAAAPRPPLSLSEHYQLNLLNVKKQLGFASVEEAASLQQLQLANSHKLDAVRDALGMKKMIIAATRDGHVFALHSGDGRVHWHSRLPTEGVPLLALRKSFVPHSAEEDSQIIAVFSDAMRGLAVTLNAYTGAIEDTKPLPLPVTHLIALPETPDHRIPYVMLGLFPPFPDSTTAFVWPKGHFVSVDTSFYVWGSDVNSGSLVGYQVSVLAGELQARRVWKVELGHELLAVQERKVVRSPGALVKVQGDRSMRFKYLNDNMLMTVHAAMLGPDEDVPAIICTIFDAVTGRVLTHQQHEQATGPVAAALFDNQAVLQFWDRRAFRWHLSVMELYDRSVPVPGMLSIISGALSGRLSQPHNVSAYMPVTLEVLRQSYFSKVGVREMTPTETLHGVTPRHLLMATNTDQIYSLDTKLIDARRPKVSKPTAAHKEERLIPYSPQLPLMPQSYATYDNLVSGVRRMVSSPAGLESTTHVFAIGRDLYYVVLRPARAFDMLDKDFSYVLLTLALVALVGSVAAMSHLTKVAKTNAKWK